MSISEDLDNIYSQTKFDKTHSVKKIVNLFSLTEKDKLIKHETNEIKLAGRVLNIRDHSHFIFADLSDFTGVLQLKLDTKKHEHFLTQVNIGDILGVGGIICKTNKNVLSLDVDYFRVLSKCFKTLPKNYYGFKNIEERFRKRYLDFIVNQNSRNIIITRSNILKYVRKYLENNDFLEVETPILVSEASGAEATPFITFHNKLNKNFFLRIATEIPLKQLLVGGFEKVFEIGKVFRNEGIDARHSPEFTTIEIYNAYTNCLQMMDLTEKIFFQLSDQLLNKKELIFNSYVIDIFKPFKKMTMKNSVLEQTGIDFNIIDSIELAENLAKKHEILLEPFQKNIGYILVLFFEKFVEPNLIQPTFIYDYPVEISPLAKTKKNDKTIADRFELYIGGLEFANAYSELNNPFEQKNRFKEQSKQKKLGNQEISNYDEIFVDALEYGMPPASGLGIGIDRLVMLYTEQNNIREVIAFPQLKDKKDNSKNEFET